MDEDGDETMPLVKPLVAALKEVAAVAEEAPAVTEAAEDLAMEDAPPEVEATDEVDEQVRTDEASRAVAKANKFGGRRRAQHPDNNVEIAMRRQALLKTAYRTMARAQKNILAEITQRNIDELESNATAHAEAAEFEGVMQALEDRLAERKALIHLQHKYKAQQLEITRDSNCELARDHCRRQIEDVEEAKIEQLNYECLRIARAAQLADGHETEDEDDTIPKLKGMNHRWKRGPGLDQAYDSRSRLAMETRRATDEMQARYNMHEFLQALPDADFPKKVVAPFTVFDDRPRTAASLNREGENALNMLATAGAEVERVASIPIIPNEQALGLQLLGDLASRPSITGGRPQSSGSISDPFLARPMPRPLQLQVPNEPTPIQLRMSPRTQIAMGDRFEPPSMPPPQTPRSEATTSARSPEVGSLDQPTGMSLTGRNPSHNQHNQWSPRVRDGPPQHEQRRSITQDSLSHILRSPVQHQLRLNSEQARRIFGEPFRKRSASHSDPAPPFTLPRDPLGSATPGRHSDKDTGPQRTAPPSGPAMKSPKTDPLRIHSLLGPEPPSQPGASNALNGEAATSKSEQPSTSADATAKAQSHKSDPSLDIGDQPKQSKPKHSVGKTNKDQRGGESRRQHKEKHKRKSGSGGTPSVATSSHAGSPPASIGSLLSPFFGHGPPMPPPRDFNPGPFHHGGPFGPLPPRPNFPFHHSLPPNPEHGFQHRNSFSGWQPPPHIGFGIPPPPGVPFDQYTSRIPPPPPPPAFHPPPPPPSITPQRQPTPDQGSRGQFGGPAIAPATSSFQSGGIRAAQPPPAFEQRLQQFGGKEDARKRSKSDQTWPKFQPPWQPKPKKE